MQGRGKSLVALAAVLFTVMGVCLTHRSAPPREATWEDVLEEARHGAYKIITTEELADRYREDSKSLFLVDTRQEWEYRTGHLKGAVNFPIEPTWWSRWRKAPALETFLGPNKDRTVVFY